MARPVPFCLLLVLGLTACPKSDSGGSSSGPGDSLTERQRDSMLAQSRIPGARGVGAAMRAADSTNARMRADSVGP
ncbi:MAG TPA: hypothetical protein VH116_08005 [Gemmatimonadales bacterium]|nr:hypothetical protein [Gemmatimonadales bacterium]